MEKLGAGGMPEAAPAAPSAGTATAVAEAEPEITRPEDRWWAPEGATLTEVVEVPRPGMSAEMLALENIIVQHFDGHDLRLPPMPRIPEVVLRELSTRDYSLRKIGSEIAEDQVTAAAVLRLANSPLYRGMHEITAVEPAVVRLGAGAIRTLMLHHTMMSLTKQERKASQRLADILSLRAVASGATMRMLAPFTGMDPDEAFLVGLLHDIGNVMVLRIINRQRPYAGRVDLETFEYLAFESHQEFAELLGDAWRLPDRLTALMSNHHEYPDAGDPLRVDRLALHVTNMIGGLLGFAFEADYDLLNANATIDLGLNDRPDFIKFLTRLPDDLDEALQAFG
ncbi:MAG: HDOD domain-containing protein [Phycisphaerales bacterium]|nr:HDOD domain-containing protein [Phycisphaerales bacterium]